MAKYLAIFTFVGAALALIFAVLTAKKVLGFSEGTEKMKKNFCFHKAGRQCLSQSSV